MTPDENPSFINFKQMAMAALYAHTREDWERKEAVREAAQARIKANQLEQKVQELSNG